MAKQEIVSMDGMDAIGSGDMYGDDVVDDMGNLINPGDEQPEDSEPVEDDEEQKTDDDDSDDEEDASGIPKEWKGIPKPAYEKFRAQHETLKEITSKIGDRNVDDMVRDASAFAELMGNAEVRKVVAKIWAEPDAAAAAVPDIPAPPDFSKMDFENMSDAEIYAAIKDSSTHAAASVLTPQLQSLTQTVQELQRAVAGITGDVQETKISGLISDEAKYPGAKQHEKPIKELMGKGLSFDQAYYATLGPDILKVGKQQGLKRMAQKKASSVHITQKAGKSSTAPTKKHSNFRDAFNAVCEREGFEL